MDRIGSFRIFFDIQNINKNGNLRDLKIETLRYLSIFPVYIKKRIRYFLTLLIDFF